MGISPVKAAAAAIGLGAVGLNDLAGSTISNPVVEQPAQKNGRSRKVSRATGTTLDPVSR